MILRNHIFLILCIQFIIFTSGCNNKILDWGKENFKQSDRYSDTMNRHALPYVRSEVVYDQMLLIANFSAFFLTDAARMLYVDYYKEHHMLTAEQEALLRKRQLHENNYAISFYVIGSQPDTVYPDNYAMFTGQYHKNSVLLGSKDAEWQIMLDVDGVLYEPESIRVTELPVEYQHFFGAAYSQFKSIYLVKFDAFNHNHERIFQNDKSYTVSLKLHSVRYKVTLAWKDIVYREHIVPA